MMNREVKFRGITIESPKRWVYGDLVKYSKNGMLYIREYNEKDEPPRYIDYPVDPETVGEFTGLQDVEEKDVYEGDVYQRYNYRYRVVWDSETTGFKGWVILRKNDQDKNKWDKESGNRFVDLAQDEITLVVGNIHEQEKCATA